MWVFLSGCSLGGGGLVNPSTSYTFARVAEQTLVELFQSSELTFADAGVNPSFSTVQECSAGSYLIINNEKIRLPRTNTQVTELGTNFFAFDSDRRYAVVVSINLPGNKVYSVADFFLLANNDIVVFRLRPAGQNDFRIASTHTLLNTPGSITVCEDSKGIVFNCEGLVFNRLSALVGLNFRGKRPG